MIDRGPELSVSRQCEILDLNRTGVYYTPRPVSDEDLILMRRIDELHLKHPFYGDVGSPSSWCGTDLKSVECMWQR
jgi:putative transposase